MYGTDIFVKFEFCVIGMPIFITNKAQLNSFNLSHILQKARTQTCTRSIEINFLTLSDVKRATRLILLRTNCRDNLCSLFQSFTC
jgi:hypothetical protein